MLVGKVITASLWPFAEFDVTLLEAEQTLISTLSNCVGTKNQISAYTSKAWTCISRFFIWIDEELQRLNQSESSDSSLTVY